MAQSQVWWRSVVHGCTLHRAEGLSRTAQIRVRCAGRVLSMASTLNGAQGLVSVRHGRAALLVRERAARYREEMISPHYRYAQSAVLLSL